MSSMHTSLKSSSILNNKRANAVGRQILSSQTEINRPGTTFKHEWYYQK